MHEMKLILVINSGSSSLKFKLFSFPAKSVKAEGQVERLGHTNAQLIFKHSDQKIAQDLGECDHESAFTVITRALINQRIIKELNDIKIVGHRVVHGGDSFHDPVVIDENVKQTIEHLSFLAPLHNPANLTGIVGSEMIFPDAMQVAVFDTAFHTTIPEFAHRYALPDSYYDDFKIRVYGFHGTSHKYVAEKWYASRGTTKGNLITIHLGNGCSMSAVKDGKCVDTSLGFSPTGGLIMGTRSGDIDPMIIPYMVEKLKMPISEITDLLNKKSGMLGITGKSDLREIIAGAENGNKCDILALEMSAYRIRKYIGAFTAAMGGTDGVIFTAGIGENSDFFRSMVMKGLGCLGMDIDHQKNKISGDLNRPIHSDLSKVEIWVIPTNEELEIAQQAYQIINV